MRKKRDKNKPSDIMYRIYHALAGVMFPVFVVIFLWIGYAAFRSLGHLADILRIVVSLTNAAIIVRLLTRNMEQGPLKTLIAWTAWIIAALYILKWLVPSAVARPGRVKVDYNWALHTALKKYDLEIPFPQKDLNIRQPAEITVRMAEK